MMPMDPIAHRARDDEWDGALALIEAETRTILDRVDASPALSRYVLAKGIGNYVYPLAGWIADPVRRRTAGLAFTLHCMGTKLFDDIIDADTCFSGSELLATGHEMLMTSLGHLSSIQGQETFITLYNRRWPEIWKVVRGEPTRRIDTLGDWLATAHVKCGCILAFYAEVAAILGGHPQQVPTVRAAIEPLGTVFTALDDFRDAANGTEDHANLKVLILRGTIGRESARAALLKAAAQFRTGLDAARPAFPFGDRFGFHIDICLQALERPDISIRR